MTSSDLQVAIEASADGRVRVCGGRPGTEEYDQGWACLATENAPYGIEPGSIYVAWDSGVVTTLPRPLDDDSFQLL